MRAKHISNRFSSPLGLFVLFVVLLVLTGAVIKRTNLQSKAASENAPPEIRSAYIPQAIVGKSYRGGFSVFDLNQGDKLTASVRGLPSGLSYFCAARYRSYFMNCTISGTPTRSGSYTVTISVADPTGASNQQAASLVIQTANEPSSTPTTYYPNNQPFINTTTLPNGKVGAVYSTAIRVSDYDPQQYLSLSATGLPPGISVGSCLARRESVITTDCSLSGTPRSAGTFPTLFTIRDRSGASSQQSIQIIIAQ